METREAQELAAVARPEPATWLANRGFPLPDSLQRALRALPERSVRFEVASDAYARGARWTISLAAPCVSLRETGSRMLGGGPPRGWVERSLWTDAAMALRVWAETVSLAARNERGRITCRLHTVLAVDPRDGSDSEDFLHVMGVAEPTDAEFAAMDVEETWWIDADEP